MLTSAASSDSRQPARLVMRRPWSLHMRRQRERMDLHSTRPTDMLVQEPQAVLLVQEPVTLDPDLPVVIAARLVICPRCSASTVCSVDTSQETVSRHPRSSTSHLLVADTEAADRVQLSIVEASVVEVGSRPDKSSSLVQRMTMIQRHGTWDSWRSTCPQANRIQMQCMRLQHRTRSANDHTHP